MAKDRDIKLMIKRVNSTMSRLEKFLDDVKVSAEDVAEVEKDRMSYKEGLVDGICMFSWMSDTGLDCVGEKNNNGEGKMLPDVLEEIGSVFGFDGKEQLERVKMVEEVGKANEEVRDGEYKGEAIKITDINGEEVERKERAEDSIDRNEH